MSETIDHLPGLPEQGLGDEGLEQRRLLVEVDNLLDRRLPDGGWRQQDEADIVTNLYTAVQENAMPSAVTTTIHRAAYTMEMNQRVQRVFVWLGRTAMRLAYAGFEYHFSEAAHKRVAVEVGEAAFSQDHLRPGIAQIFISPKMTEHDAPAEIAKQEHLHDDDALRVSYAVTNSEGEVIARRMQSLLLKDVPLEAWLRMLRDPDNIFGKAMDIKDERSALSVMELFRELELPEDKLPEGPVTLVEAVLPYIDDAAAGASVVCQLDKFRSDQLRYELEAAEKAAEWLAFEKGLAESLYHGKATLEVRQFIASLQDEWGRHDLSLIRQHETADGGYRMSRQLAARLEKAKQNVLNGEAAIVTGNQEVRDQLDDEARQRIDEHIAFIKALQAAGVAEVEIRLQRAALARDIARQRLSVGGGCMGKNKADFGDSDNLLLDTEAAEPQQSGAGEGGDKKDWKWSTGICRVKACRSPKPTRVGPCSVCRGCQRVFDAGGDPTKSYVPKPKERSRATVDTLAVSPLRFLIKTPVTSQQKLTLAA